MAGAPPAVVTAASAVALFFLASPAVGVWAAWQEPEKRLRDVKAFNLWAMYMNSMLWLVYTYFLVPAAVPVNVVGVAMPTAATLLLTAVAAKLPKDADGGDWTSGRSMQLATVASTATVVTVAYTMAAPFGDALGHVGVAAMLLNIVMFGAPLEAVQQVIKQKDASALPRQQVLAGLACSALWSAVSHFENSLSMLVPNACGFVLNALQLGLILAYPGVKKEE
eukprot:TRINITY_DN10725_c0_g1_i1.p1 TRINITY_DN10725_c0_g1~~TRINITY_DN10725_c0_g1_i1.p1  ORF type:complete len:223 (-),score=64.67 TRINITY_DN10725_c0_g1_i1:249-917(-)